MWNNLPWVLQKLWELPGYAGLDRAGALHALLPNLHVIRLTRRDRVRQAVSWARAAQDSVWVVSETEPAVPTAELAYDHELIAGLEGLLAEGEQGWADLCAELGVDPLDVLYEDLVDPSSYPDVIRSVLDHLGIVHDEIAIPQPRTHQQADVINDDWVRRYSTDRANLRHSNQDPR
jgi:LPS sulfotransferase NodH